jgi:hypothetical protein
MLDSSVSTSFIALDIWQRYVQDADMGKRFGIAAGIIAPQDYVDLPLQFGKQNEIVTWRFKVVPSASCTAATAVLGGDFFRGNGSDLNYDSMRFKVCSGSEVTVPMRVSGVMTTNDGSS